MTGEKSLNAFRTDALFVFLFLVNPCIVESGVSWNMRPIDTRPTYFREHRIIITCGLRALHSGSLLLSAKGVEFLGISLSTSSLPIITASILAPGGAQRRLHMQPLLQNSQCQLGSPVRVWPGMTAASKPRTRDTDVKRDGGKGAVAPFRRQTR